jgi:hypothetical protein
MLRMLTKITHLIVLVGCLANLSQVAIAADKPNFVFFLSDDRLKADYGLPIDLTPTTDQLAREGMGFDKMFTAQAIPLEKIGKYTYRSTATTPKGPLNATDTIPSYDWDLSDIWYSTSEDGSTWTEQGPAVERLPKPQYGWRSSSTTCILKWKGRFYLYYQGQPLKLDDGKDRIIRAQGVATAPDPQRHFRIESGEQYQSNAISHTSVTSIPTRDRAVRNSTPRSRTANVYSSFRIIVVILNDDQDHFRIG